MIGQMAIASVIVAALSAGIVLKAERYLFAPVAVVAAPAAVAALGSTGSGNGNAFANGNATGAKGAPLPLAGVTATGQVVMLVGGVLIWRRRRKHGKSRVN